MISSAVAMRGFSGRSASQGRGSEGMRRCETEKPVRPALGLPPRPVAPSSRISPPAPVAAPGKGEMAVGWLWVSTLMQKAESTGALWPYSSLPGSARKRAAGWPSTTAALSLYAVSVSCGDFACVFLIIRNSDNGCGSPSMVQSALKILWRQCSELACANIISSASDGSRPSSA